MTVIRGGLTFKHWSQHDKAGSIWKSSTSVGSLINFNWQRFAFALICRGMHAQTGGTNGPPPSNENTNCPHFTTNGNVICPTVSNPGAIDSNYFCVDANVANYPDFPIVLPSPTLIEDPEDAGDGMAITNVTETCSNIVTSTTNAITLTFGGLMFDPDPRTNTIIPGNDYTADCYTIGTPSPTNVGCALVKNDYGTVTWHVLNTNAYCHPSGSEIVNAYFAVEGIGYQPFTHTLTEVYYKDHFCDDPTEKWDLRTSISSLLTTSSSYAWSCQHKYSFQTTWTDMPPASGGMSVLNTIFLSLSSGIWLLPPQPSLSGSDNTTYLAYIGESSITPGIPVGGLTVTMP